MCFWTCQSLCFSLPISGTHLNGSRYFVCHLKIMVMTLQQIWQPLDQALIWQLTTGLKTSGILFFFIFYQSSLKIHVNKQTFCYIFFDIRNYLWEKPLVWQSLEGKGNNKLSWWRNSPVFVGTTTTSALRHQHNWLFVRTACWPRDDTSAQSWNWFWSG